MTTGRLRRRAGDTELAADEGPFVSFTDLFIGILFLFLILVAVLMLMHQQSVEKDKAQTQVIARQLQQIKAELDTTAKLEDMAATGRNPTDEEWNTLNATIAGLRGELHKG